MGLPPPRVGEATAEAAAPRRFRQQHPVRQRTQPGNDSEGTPSGDFQIQYQVAALKMTTSRTTSSTIRRFTLFHLTQYVDQQLRPANQRTQLR